MLAPSAAPYQIKRFKGIGGIVWVRKVELEPSGIFAVSIHKRESHQRRDIRNAIRKELDRLSWPCRGKHIMVVDLDEQCFMQRQEQM